MSQQRIKTPLIEHRLTLTELASKLAALAAQNIPAYPAIFDELCQHIPIHLREHFNRSYLAQVATFNARELVQLATLPIDLQDANAVIAKAIHDVQSQFSVSSITELNHHHQILYMVTYINFFLLAKALIPSVLNIAQFLPQ